MPNLSAKLNSELQKSRTWPSRFQAKVHLSRFGRTPGIHRVSEALVKTQNPKKHQGMRRPCPNLRYRNKRTEVLKVQVNTRSPEEIDRVNIVQRIYIDNDCTDPHPEVASSNTQLSDCRQHQSAKNSSVITDGDTTVKVPAGMWSLMHPVSMGSSIPKVCVDLLPHSRIRSTVTISVFYSGDIVANSCSPYSECLTPIKFVQIVKERYCPYTKPPPLKPKNPSCANR